VTQASEKIHDILTRIFHPSALRVEDESWKHVGHAGAKDGGGHFVVYITSQAFSGKSRVACHRLVNQALKEEFSSLIHALSIHTKG